MEDGEGFADGSASAFDDGLLNRTVPLRLCVARRRLRERRSIPA
jgi:hypothetical protein